MFNHWGRLFLVAVIASRLAFADAVAPVTSPRLSYATYAGTGPNSVVRGFSVDSQGYAYIVGSGPGTGGSSCGFVTKLSQTGSAAVWSVCLPVAEVDGIALDAAGYVYVVGKNPPLDSVNTAVAMKLSADGQHTIYTTQIGGVYGEAIAVDSAGSVYLAGAPDPTFQATPGAYMSAGGQAVVVKLTLGGSIEYATYVDLFGDGIVGPVLGLTVDSRGQAWIVGTTCPTASGALGTQCDTDRYGTAAGIRKLDSGGAHVLVSRGFGGGPSDAATPPYEAIAAAVAVDGADSAWIVGNVQGGGVPTTTNALEPQPPLLSSYSQGAWNGFVVKLSSSGDLLYGTYLGNVAGSHYGISAIAVDAAGRPYVALNDETPSRFGNSSAVMGLSADGASLLVSAGFDSAVDYAALDGSGGLYLAGNTVTEVLATPGAYQPLYPGGVNSGYVAKFDLTTSAPAAQFSYLVNAASLTSDAVTPGEIVALMGSNLPTNPNLTFDGHAAPILYSDTNQINAVVPFEVTAPSTVVSLAGVRGYVLPVWPAVPALFTSNASGSGQVSALNEDWTVNSAASPAKPGSVVAVYMTGVGAMNPPIADGQIGPAVPPYPMPVLGASASLKGVSADVTFIGQAPDLIAGAIQVNIRIPEGTPSGNAVLVVYIGNYRTQVATTTIAVE